MKEQTRRLTYTAMALTFALMAGYFERMIPPPLPMLPGIKLGVANFAIIAVMYLMDTKAALWVDILKVIITGMLFTGLFAMGYALSGAALSFLLMWISKRSGLFGVVGVSIVGGAAHNTGQILFAAAIMNEYRLLYYLPVLVISGVAAGAVIGYLAGLFVRRAWRII